MTVSFRGRYAQQFPAIAITTAADQPSHHTRTMALPPRNPPSATPRLIPSKRTPKYLPTLLAVEDWYPEVLNAHLSPNEGISG